jgi:transcriptional regulator with XRE-family HTH domain
MNISNNLKILRSQKGITQNELSKILNINRATYAHYETGRREPDIETLKLLADYFGVSVDFLLGNNIEKNNEYKINSSKDLNKVKESNEVYELIEKDILKDVKNIIYKMDHHGTGVYFNGQEMDEESKELFKSLLDVALKTINVKNKGNKINKKHKNEK